MSVEKLFLFIKQKSYDEAIELVKSQPELINAVNPLNGNSLFQSLIGILTSTESLERLIKEVITSPKFDFGYVSTKYKKTNVDTLVSSERLDLFESAINNPGIVFNRDKLAYQSLKDNLVRLQKIFESEMQKDPSSLATAKAKARIEKQEQIIALLRDETILYAISIDEPGIFDLLQQAGANPADRLGKFGGEKLPSHLLTDAHPNLKSWFKTRLSRMVEETSSNPNSFLNKAKRVEQIEQKRTDLEIDHLTARTEINKKFIEGDKQFVEQAISTLKIN